MSPCSYAHLTSFDTRSLGPACRRLGAALAASVVVHLWLVGALSGSSPAGRGEALRFSSITASLERTIPAATPATIPELPDALRERAAPVRERLVTPPRTVSSPSSPREGARPTDGAVREAPDATYYPARQLDVYPTLAVPLNLPYAQRALEAGVEGRALLLLHIDETGVVDEVAVVEAQPVGYFEEDARRAFVAARFTPGQRNGRPVKSRVLVEVTYGESSAR